MLARWEAIGGPSMLEHVERATFEEALLYVGVIALWLGGVAVLIVRKLRAAA